MLARYWVRFEDRTVGPHSLKILHELPGFGRDTLVCPAGEVVWRKADEVESIRALFEAKSDEEIEEMLMSPKERRRLERKRKAREEKERFKKSERAEREQERVEKMKSLSQADKGFNPMWIVLTLIVAGAVYGAYTKWKKAETEKAEVAAQKEQPLPHPDRENHWAWKTLGKTAAEVEAEFGADSVESIKPDGSARFESGGDLGRWSRYDTVLILIPKGGAVYGASEGIAVAALRDGKVRGVGRRYDARDPEDMPKLAEVLPASFSTAIAPRVENENTWRLKWDVGRENWGALVRENPGAEGDVKEWRVKEFWLTKPE